ncbi:MAG: hypothetical protein EPN86_06570 [Nanoarchaeota archaeon]|nr:MAG: hypothetical protein EPN86_06570 [Nanoarchaeota archaeon]
MNTVYEGDKIVYIQSYGTDRHIKRTKATTAPVTDAYFFTLSPERDIVKEDFDKSKVSKADMGLMIEVSVPFGEAGLSIAGQEDIVSFLVNTGTLGKDLSVLQGREVTAYVLGKSLYGIGIESP